MKTTDHLGRTRGALGRLVRTPPWPRRGGQLIARFQHDQSAAVSVPLSYYDMLGLAAAQGLPPLADLRRPALAAYERLLVAPTQARGGLAPAEKGRVCVQAGSAHCTHTRCALNALNACMRVVSMWCGYAGSVQPGHTI
jgi:hypothetical protein